MVGSLLVPCSLAESVAPAHSLACTATTTLLCHIIGPAPAWLTSEDEIGAATILMKSPNLDPLPETLTLPLDTRKLPISCFITIFLFSYLVPQTALSMVEFNSLNGYTDNLAFGLLSPPCSYSAMESTRVSHRLSPTDSHLGSPLLAS